MIYTLSIFQSRLSAGLVLLFTAMVLYSCRTNSSKPENIPVRELSFGDTLSFRLDYAPYYQYEIWQNKGEQYFVFYDTQTAKKISLFDLNGNLLEEKSIKRVLDTLPFGTRKILFRDRDTMGFCSSNKQRIFWVNWAGEIWDTTFVRPTGAKRPHYCLFSQNSTFFNSDHELFLTYSRDPVFKSEGLSEIQRLQTYYRLRNRDSVLIKITNLWDSNINYQKCIPKAEYLIDSSFQTVKTGPKFITSINNKVYFYSPYANSLFAESGEIINLPFLKRDLTDIRWTRPQTIEELISYAASTTDELNKNYSLYRVEELNKDGKIMVLVKAPSNENYEYDFYIYILNKEFEPLYKVYCEKKYLIAYNYAQIGDKLYFRIRPENQKPERAKLIQYVHINNL